MESTYMFNDISSEELYDIDGGSTKVAAAVFGIVGSIFGVASSVAGNTGHPVVSACLAGAATTCALAGAWCVLAPLL